nr:glycoprotein vIgFam3 [Elephant endotheliotropic herpesvirus 1A]
MALDYTKAWRMILCCCITYLVLISIDRGVMAQKSSIETKFVGIGGNVSLELNTKTNYSIVTWMHNTSQIVLLWKDGNKKITRPNIQSQSPSCMTITNAQRNDSGLYTAVGLMPANGKISTTRFSLKVNDTSMS